MYILFSQVDPSKPSAHWQLKLFIPSLHVPPFRQGSDLQSSISGKANLNENFFDPVQCAYRCLNSFLHSLAFLVSIAVGELAFSSRSQQYKV